MPPRGFNAALGAGGSGIWKLVHPIVGVLWYNKTKLQIVRRNRKMKAIDMTLL
jgi:hypothetical protein